jgi:5-methylcytosine-specific restriction endonuclease McrA
VSTSIPSLEVLALSRAGVVRPRDLARGLGISAHAATEHIRRWRKCGLIAAASRMVSVGDREARGEAIVKPVSRIDGRPQRVHPGRRYSPRREGTRRCVECATSCGPPRRGSWSERCRRGQRRRKRGSHLHRGRTPVALRRAVIARDGHRCGICRRPVDPSLRGPHPLSLSIDHIVPLIAGGDDSLADLQVAHLACDIAKGDRLPAWLERAAA